MSSENSENDKVKYEDWIGGGSENSDNNDAFGDDADLFKKDQYEGMDGHMRLQMQKTYGDDDRFKLDEGFDINFADANKVKAHIPDKLIGALNERELEGLKVKAKREDEKYDLQEPTEKKMKKVMFDEDMAWHPNINVDKERDQAFHILSQIVPANEIFLTSSKSGNANTLKKQQGQGTSFERQEGINRLVGKGDQAGTKNRAMHIKRFDPRNPLSKALLIPKKTKEEKANPALLTNQKDIKKQMLEQGRMQVLNKRNMNQNAVTLDQMRDELQQEFQGITQGQQGQMNDGSKQRSIQITAGSWKNIIKKDKEDKTEVAEKPQQTQKLDEAQNDGGFMLCFDDDQNPEEPKTEAEIQKSKEKAARQAEREEREAERAAKIKADKKEFKLQKKLEKKKAQEAKKDEIANVYGPGKQGSDKNADGDIQQELKEMIKVDGEGNENDEDKDHEQDGPKELPNKIKKRIEKRKRKKIELRQRQKETKIEKIDYYKNTDEEIIERYKKVYPDRTEENIQEYVKCQRLIFESKNRRKINNMAAAKK